MNDKKIIFLASVIFSLIFFCNLASSLPPHPIFTTSISPPPESGTPEKVIEIKFYVNQSNQITLQSLSIQNLALAVVDTTSGDYRLEITDANSQVLFRSNILVIFDPQTNLSNQYYAIPYASGAKYLNFYYKNANIAQYEIPQEFPFFYVMIGAIVAVIVVALAFVIYYMRKNYTIQT